ncbi:methyltransferase domain-containing protein [Oscillibacter ruminantium]
MVIGEGVWLASNVTVLGPCTIGDDAVLAAGSVVLPHTVIPPGTMYAGIPAKFVKKLTADEPQSRNRGDAMNHKDVDNIMKDVLQIYRGDFSVNGDDGLSHQISRQLKEQNQNRFTGSNGAFGVNQMSCSDGCTKAGNQFIVPHGGIVFGPYVTFPLGTYVAHFYLDGDVSACTLMVSSQSIGTIASTQVDHATTENGYILPFSLNSSVENVELKVVNEGTGDVIFEKVCVYDRDWKKEERPVLAKTMGNVSDSNDDLYALLAEELDVGTRQVEMQVNSAEEGQECSLPATTQHRKIKAFFRKLLNSYIVFQVDFNHKTVYALKAMARQFHTVISGMTLFSQQLSNQKEQLEALASRLDEQEQALKAHAADSRQKEQLEALASRLDEQAQALKAHAADSRQMEQLEALATRLDEQAQASADRDEITHLWDKIRQFDADFKAIWAHDRDTNANLNSVWQTYNTMRQEVFYEIDHRCRQSGASAEKTGPQEPRILSGAAEKIAAQGGRIRLNLGSGDLPVDGYLSVDARELPSVDVVADVEKLPYPAGTVDEIFSAHLIEHFSQAVMEKELLPYWYSLLKPNGEFRVIFPDLAAMIETYQAGSMTFEELGRIIMGGQDYQLDYHYAVYSPETVCAMLERAGFRDIQLVARGRENGGCKESEIHAVK